MRKCTVRYSWIRLAQPYTERECWTKDPTTKHFSVLPEEVPVKLLPRGTMPVLLRAGWQQRQQRPHRHRVRTRGAQLLAACRTRCQVAKASSCLKNKITRVGCSTGLRPFHLWPSADAPPRLYGLSFKRGCADRGAFAPPQSRDLRDHSLIHDVFFQNVNHTSTQILG